MKSRHIALSILLLVVLLTSSSEALAQAPDQVADLFARMNSERIARGKTPYAYSAVLGGAAQAHASDMSQSGKLSHTGSDGSTIFDRTARAGYGTYSWGRRVGENWAWYRDTATAMQKWMASSPHRNNILHDVYREVGIGIAKGPIGGFIYVVNFGAQPNVLPMLINNGSANTNSPNVTLTLNDEDVYDSSPSSIGHVTQVQLSNRSDFAGATWSPFAQTIPWSLPSGSGGKTVYVKYRDSRGRTATASDSITLGSGPTPVLKPLAPTITQTEQAAPSRTRTAQPTNTRTATRTVTRTPTSTRTRTVTRTPSPSFTPTDTSSRDARLGPPVGGASLKTNSAIAPTPTPSIGLVSATEKPFPTSMPTDAPEPTILSAPTPLPDSVVQYVEPAPTTMLKIAAIPEPVKNVDTLPTVEDASALAIVPDGTDETGPENPAEPFSYGVLIVGLLMSAMAFGKFILRNHL